MTADGETPPATVEHEASADTAAYFFHLAVAIARYRDVVLEKSLRPLGLNVSRCRALGVVARLEPCSMTDLAGFSAVDRTTMTRVVDQLVDDGLVVRAQPPRDRRQVLLTLTPKGRRAHAASMQIITASNQAALKGVPDETLRAAIRAKRTIVGNLIDNEDLAERLLGFGSPAGELTAD